VQFVQMGRHTRIAILNKITDYMPNPTFERVAAPGAHEKFYAGRTPRASRCARCPAWHRHIPAFRKPGPRIAELDARASTVP
jgi:hypothetical protein